METARVDPARSRVTREHFPVGVRRLMPEQISTHREAQIPGSSSLLTPRELEVAGLVARGRSNREIAQQLVIAVSTAERHVANVLGKLGLTRRMRWLRA